MLKLMKNFRAISCISFFSICNFSVSGQDNSINLGVNTGYSLETLHQKNTDNWNNFGNTFSLGIQTEKFTAKDNKSFIVGLVYQHRKLNNYSNSFFDINYQEKLILSTSISQNLISVPFIFKYETNKIFYGLGINFTYLLTSELNQFVKSSNAPDWIIESFHATYDLSKYNELSPFSRVNLAPSIYIGKNLNKKIRITACLSYEFISNPRNYFKFSQYNLFSSSINLTYNIKSL